MHILCCVLHENSARAAWHGMAARFLCMLLASPPGSIVDGVMVVVVLWWYMTL